MLLAQRTPESRHQAASKKLARAKQRMEKQEFAIDSVRSKIKVLQDDLATKLAEKAATYANMLALQDECTRTALEATGGKLDSGGGQPNAVDEEIAGASGIDPACLRMYLEKMHAKQQHLDSLSARLVNDAAGAASPARASAAQAHPAPATFPAAPCTHVAGAEAAIGKADDVEESDAESEFHESDHGRSRSPRARMQIRKEARAAAGPGAKSPKAN